LYRTRTVPCEKDEVPVRYWYYDSEVVQRYSYRYVDPESRPHKKSSHNISKNTNIPKTKGKQKSQQINKSPGTKYNMTITNVEIITHKHADGNTRVIYEAAHKLRESNEELNIEAYISSTATVDDSKEVDNTVRTEIKSNIPRPFKFIPLQMGGNGRTHVVSNESTRLIDEEVTLDDLVKLTTLFYEKAFLDPTLDQFIRSHGDPHAERFAKWIHQKLSGSTIWDDERRHRSRKPVVLAEGIRHVVHDRSSAHAAAWYSPKRPLQDVGRHFALDECRVWMRLHFWALRESGVVEKSPSFADYYVRFIAHFVRVYESTAPKFARDSYRWSASRKNIESYIDTGHRMVDVLGLTLSQAQGQLRDDELRDDNYPYNIYPTSNYHE
jgi:hypothetical protein